MAQICETVMVTTMAELRLARDESRADLVELRLDSVTDLDVAGALAGRRLPVIVTCRAAWEGGRFEGSEEERLRVLSQAIDLGAEFIDVEWRADRRGLPPTGSTRVVLSHHDMEGTPPDAADRVEAMRQEARNGIVKFAAAVREIPDLVRLREIAGRDAGEHVVIGMGARGTLTRVCPGRLGSLWTYGGAAASGQVPVDILDRLYRVRTQRATTRVFAVTGSPLAHSASPAMHNAALAALGLDAVYVPLESAHGDEVLAVADAFGIDGLSVTAPLKTVWSALGVTLDDVAAAVGAANTLERTATGWRGRNSDVEGFLAPLASRGISLRGARCVVLGAGGAARAVAYAAQQSGARVEIAARDASRAAVVVQDAGAEAAGFPPAPGWDLLVNATPAGTWPDVDVAPIPREFVRGRVVYDLVYHPPRTQLLRWAEESGATTIGGLEMLVQQAARQFEGWTGRPAPIEVMRRVAEDFLDQHDWN